MTRRCNIHVPRYAYLEQAKVSSKILHIKSTVTVVERMDHTEVLSNIKISESRNAHSCRVGRKEPYIGKLENQARVNVPQDNGTINTESNV